MSMPKIQYLDEPEHEHCGRCGAELGDSLAYRRARTDAEWEFEPLCAGCSAHPENFRADDDMQTATADLERALHVLADDPAKAEHLLHTTLETLGLLEAPDGKAPVH